MKHYEETENISDSSQHSGLSYKTASKYIKEGYPESSEGEDRQWRTRKDPFEEIWIDVESRLKGLKTMGVSRIRATDLFDEYLERYPSILTEGMLRSFQRRVGEWKRKNETAKTPEAYFEQIHKPGHFLEMDWFYSKTLEVNIRGEHWKHLICHSVLTYSNWEWAEPCESESFASLKTTLQWTLFELGHLPLVFKTDNSSTATHQLGGGKAKNQKRPTNKRLLEVLDYYGMRHQSIEIGKANQNGDIESANGHLREYLIGRLALRGSKEFESKEKYRDWLQEQLMRINRSREGKLELEKKHMRKLVQKRLPDYERVSCIVNKYGLVRIGKGSYSVPREWRHKKDLEGRIHESKIEIWSADKCLASFSSTANESGARIDYRHLLPDLIKKAGAFANYRYREEFIPGDAWRYLYDQLLEKKTEKQASKEYLSILELTLVQSKSAVEKTLYRLFEKKEISLELVKKEMGLLNQPEDHPNNVAEPDLDAYDNLRTITGVK